MQSYFLTPTYKKIERVRRSPELSEKERNRLKAIEVWQKTRDADFVCETFEMSRATLYRWIGRYDPRNILSLREKSRRPKNVRSPLWPADLIKAVRQLRNQYPRWGKEKLVVLLHKQGFQTSASTVGRILCSLKKRGALIEPKPNHVSAHKNRRKRPYAIRKPKDFSIQAPGDLVQLDTLDIRPVPDVMVKQFTARDYISRWDVCQVYSRATARTATSFLDILQDRMPFAIKAIQIDGGSEFFSEFRTTMPKTWHSLIRLTPQKPKTQRPCRTSKSYPYRGIL